MRFGRRLSTDLGTVILHWLLVVFFVGAALSGLRIASDDPGLQWLRILDAILPVERIWLIHMVSATGLTATLIAYCVYIVRARLTPRLSFGAVQLSNLFAAGRMRWSAAGALAHWVFIAAMILEIATGLSLFLGFNSGSLNLHCLGAWICLAFPAVHVGCHWAYGKGSQLLRVVRPANLVLPTPPPDFAGLLAHHLTKDISKPDGIPQPMGITERRRPLLWAFLAALGATALATAIEPLTSQTLIAVKVSPTAVPHLDGDVSDPAWAYAPVTKLLTQHGANFAGGSGESMVEVRAVHDGTTIYFAFTWDDPTRSLKNLPLVKRKDGWHLVQTAHDHADEETYCEDKFAVLVARPALRLIGAAIHLAAQPLAGQPASLTGRGLHYLPAGGLADVWQWHADRADIIDDGYFSAPLAATPGQTAGLQRYNGGFVAERGSARYADNFEPPPPGGIALPVRPRRLPKDPAAMAIVMGRLSDNPDLSEQLSARWWMGLAESVAYSQAADAAIATGTVIPGVIVLQPKPGSSGIAGAARWSAGRWTLTLARKMKPATASGVPIETGTMMWVAAFDHSETRHTRHLRPLILEIDNAGPK